MSTTDARPIIIKRKKVSGGDGHHGGAWKVAYADFVTAMMAFFMLMWLLNATTEQQRKGLADYFAPSIPINRTSGGGDGAFGGNMMLSDVAAQDGIGGTDRQHVPGTANLGAGAEHDGQTAALEAIEEMLVGSGGESLLSDELLAHVITRVTDEGLVIEIYSLPDAPIFAEQGDVPTAVTSAILQVVGRVSQRILNDVAIAAHLPRRPVVLASNPVFETTQARAFAARDLLLLTGLSEERIDRLTANGDRDPATEDASALRNDRLEIVLLRMDDT